MALQQVGSDADPVFLQVQIHTEISARSLLASIVQDMLADNLFSALWFLVLCQSKLKCLQNKNHCVVFTVE